MFKMNDHDQRTHAPTRKRLDDARLDGQAALSPDLVGSVVLGAGVGSVLYFSGSIFSALLTITRSSLGNIANLRLNEQSASTLVSGTIEQILVIISPIMLLILVSALVMTWLQVGFRVRFGEVLPDLKRIDPVRGAGRILGFEGLGRIGMGILKMIAVAAVLIPGIWGILKRSEEVGAATTTVGFTGLIPVGLLVMELILQSCGVLLIISSLDWAHRRWVHRRSLMMSQREVEDERKDLVGNPLMRRRRRETHKKILSERTFEPVSAVDLKAVDLKAVCQEAVHPEAAHREAARPEEGSRRDSR